MNIVIPPLIFYLIGAALVIGGTVRALTLGRRHPDREISDDDPARARARRRHFTFGLVWVAMGLFLIMSTVGVLRSKWGSRDEVVAPPPSSTLAPTATGGAAAETTPRLLPGPTLRLEPAPPTTADPPGEK